MDAREPAGVRSWSTTVADDRWGRVRLSGRWLPVAGADTAVVVVHGLGGSPASPSCRRFAQWAAGRGWSSLRLALRGADRRGEDLYHAGLTADITAALGGACLRPYRRIFLLGYSLGGHTVLRWALAPTDPRVRAVVAVSSPLALAAASTAIDRPRRALYRHYLLSGLKDMARAAHRRGRLPIERAGLHRVMTMRAWDERVIAPRFGFQSVEEYYETQSVAPQMGELVCPALIIHAPDDPMVAPDAVLPALETAPSWVEVRLVPEGGHVGFPPDLDLGFGPQRGLEGQLFTWLDAQ